LDPGEPMQAIARLWRMTRFSVTGFVADSKALAAIEFAMILPLMLVMFFGTVEISTAVAIDRKVTLMARMLSDLTSQSSGTVTDSYLQNAFTASIAVASPYDATPVKATISEVYVSSSNVATISWSKAATISSGATQATLTTSTRNAGDTVTTAIPAKLLVAKSYLIFSEVSYQYKPTGGYVVKSALNLSDVSYTRPRQVSCIIYNSVPAASCPTP
jgi:Flp pilus assembly protein TadG